MFAKALIVILQCKISSHHGTKIRPNLFWNKILHNFILFWARISGEKFMRSKFLFSGTIYLLVIKMNPFCDYYFLRKWEFEIIFKIKDTRFGQNISPSEVIWKITLSSIKVLCYKINRCSKIRSQKNISEKYYLKCISWLLVCISITCITFGLAHLGLYYGNGFIQYTIRVQHFVQIYTHWSESVRLGLRHIYDI